MRVHERERVGDGLRAWLLARLPEAEFAVQLAAHPDLVVEVADEPGRPRAAAVGTERLQTLTGVELFVAVVSEADRAVAALVPSLARQVDVRGGCELLGPGEVAGALAAQVAVHVGGTTTPVMRQRLLAATSVVHPRGVPGRARPAGRADRVLLAGWLDAFAVEALDAEPRGLDHWVEQVAEAGGALQVWEHDDRPVSLVMVRTTTPVSSRVGPVWTPPELRGRGFAAALTAAVTADALAAGDQRVVLLTDVANATSNRLYERIGYVEVCPHESWVVRAPS